MNRKGNKELVTMNKASKEVQYPYAFDENDHLVCIDNVVEETRHDHQYHCPNCGGAMLPRLGKVNAHCFAHSENQKCGVESYIHVVAKRILTNRFNDRSRPFIVKFRTQCICKDNEICKGFTPSFCEKGLVDKFDLHHFYDLPAQEEVRIKDSSGEVYQPDVILQSSEENRAPIYLEVFHKHKISDQKRESGNSIIEIRVNDWQELLNLDQLVLQESDRVLFYNFKKRRMKRDEFRKKAEEIASMNEDIEVDSLLPLCYRPPKSKRELPPNTRLILYPSGKYFTCRISENEMEKHKLSAVADITYNQNRIHSSFDPLGVLAERIPKVRRCSMCHHCRTNEAETNVWCELVKNGSVRKNTFDNQKAVSCTSFEYGIPSAGQSVSFKEGTDYVIWINPSNMDQSEAKIL